MRTSDLGHAKALRTAQTPAEDRLWYHLRAHRFLGLKFKRQKPTGPYIVDFICLERGLVVELDGGQHGEQLGYDQRRDAWLTAQGLAVLRFWNHEVMNEVTAVLERIRQFVEAPSPPTSTRHRHAGNLAYDRPRPVPTHGIFRCWDILRRIICGGSSPCC